MNLSMTSTVTLVSMMSLLSGLACDGDPDHSDDGMGDQPSCSRDTDCSFGKVCRDGRCEMESVSGDPVPLKEAKLIIEHNATDEDTGFQGFVDSDGWKRLSVTGPAGPVLAFEGLGKLRELGLTELFFETVEPENAKVPIAEVLNALPEGEYVFEGVTSDGKPTTAKAPLSHAIPAGPKLTAPEPGATVASTNLVMRWEAVDETTTGESIEIVRYQLIVEKDEEPHARSIGKGLSIYVPASVTSVTVPSEFLEPRTAYLWEVLAISESGNQTLSSSEFMTE